VVAAGAVALGLLVGGIVSLPLWARLLVGLFTVAGVGFGIILRRVSKESRQGAPVRPPVSASAEGEAPGKKSPKFEFVGIGYPRAVYISQFHRIGVIEPTTRDQEEAAVSALTLRFRNVPSRNAARAINVVAQVRFSSKDRAKHRDVDYGVWLNTPCDCIGMEVGDTHELVLLLLDGTDPFCLRDLRHNINREYEEYFKMDHVEWFHHVDVTLIDQISHASNHWSLQIWHDGQGWCVV